MGAQLSRIMIFTAFLGLMTAEVSGEETQFAFYPDVFSHHHTGRKQISLNGSWELKRDPEAIGKRERWQSGETSFPEKMTVPGTPQAQGIGQPHHYQKTHFTGPFWIRRQFLLPHISARERVWLRVGGILPAAEIYLNGSSIGVTKSSRTQQRVDITSVIRCGDSNLIAIEVLPPPEVRLDGLLEWEQGTQLWSGPYRPIAVEIAHQASVLDVYLEPELEERSLTARIWISTPHKEPLDFELTVKNHSQVLGSSTARMQAGDTSFETDISLGDFVPWAPDHPQLYTLEIISTDRRRAVLERAVLRFGMREIETRGTRFFLNGKPLFLRVFGEDHYYPETLSPPADKSWYLERLLRARAYGFNAVKGCVDTIPQEYLEACDEAGILVIQEMPFGLSTLRSNRHTIDAAFREYYSKELDGLVRVSRNHASVVAYSMSSELNFNEQTEESFSFFSQELVHQSRKLCPHALVIDCTGYVNSEVTAKGRRDTDFYTSYHPEGAKEVLDEYEIPTDGKHPTILHEYSWWSSYPDPNDREKYKDAQLLPFWLDRLEETALEQGQSDMIPIYRRNSLWLQALARKDGIEYARRNTRIEGFVLWLLVDFGHWSEGLFDDFWNPKNVTAEEFLKSNADTVVVLAREGDRCWRSGERVEIPLAISHYGETDLRGMEIRWTANGGPCTAEGQIAVDIAENGKLTQTGSAIIPVPFLETAYKVELTVSLEKDQSIINTNNWSFWAFPETRKSVDKLLLDQLPNISTFLKERSTASIPENTEILISNQPDARLFDFLEAGGKVLLFAGNEIAEKTLDKTRDYGTFRTIPWNRGDSGNSGTVIIDHPALGTFPHEGFCDLPFLYLLKGHLPLGFEPLREYGVEPIIRNIDHYYSNRNLAFLAEFEVGEGALLISTLGVLDLLESRIEARYLLNQLVTHCREAEASPAITVPREVLDSFLEGTIK